MSSHQRAAGTGKWKSGSIVGLLLRDLDRDRVTTVRARVSTRPSTWSAARCQCVPGAVGVPPAAAAFTRYAVGTSENGLSMRISAVAGLRTKRVCIVQAPQAELVGRRRLPGLHVLAVDAVQDSMSLSSTRRASLPLARGSGAPRALRGPDRLRRRERPAGSSGGGRGATRSAAARARDRAARVREGRAVRRRAVLRRRGEADPRADRREETLAWVPPWLGRRMEMLGELDAARCVLVPLVPPGLLDGVDPARAGLDRLPTVEETFKTIDDRSIAWTLSPSRARLGTARVSRARGEALDCSGSDVAHVCRLDEPDPARRGTTGSSRSSRWRAVSTRSSSTPCTSKGPVPISPSASCRRRASRRRAGRPRRARRAARAEHPDRRGLHDARPGADGRCRRGDEAARRRGLARDRPAHPLRGRPRRRDRRRRERRRAARALRDRRGRVTARRGRARRPREPHRQARAARSSRRCSTRTRRVTSRSATRTPHRSPTMPICRGSTKAQSTSTS